MFLNDLDICLLGAQIIKQTIMTTVYGVTKFGARTQISGQLRHVPNFSPELIFPSMSYLADKTFQSLHQMFGSMKEIQVCLARDISCE